MSKPNKKQKAIIKLLTENLSEEDSEELLALIDDDKLTELFQDYFKAEKKLEEYLSELETEVKPFLPDDSDF